MTIYTPGSKRNPGSALEVQTTKGGRPASGGTRQGEFRQILEAQQAVGRNVQGKEKCATRLEGAPPAAQAKAGKNADTGFAVSAARNDQAGVLRAAVTSTLLRLNALTAPRSGALLSGVSEGLSTNRALAPLARMAALRAASATTIPSRPSNALGSLSARFESGEAGVDAIGYDRQGGTSYGQYQISSRAGTMDAFLDYLDEHAPGWARDLRTAGPANTGGRGGAMPREWKRIASEAPQRFADLQRDFIERTHYVPALEEIRDKTGVDVKGQSRALQEVLWSTAVQHGARGAARLFTRAIEQSGAEGGGGPAARRVIDGLYAERAEQFGSSSSDVRSAVQRRFQEERKLAVGMLESESRRGRGTA
ncbi:MAG: hypothetical protein MUF52_03590 [Syntrophobacteraceae bacterium]|nr:hypothetical protein [Syntrophobacteraceae bacterium]